ncbi:DotU/TssL family secretion system protein [Burkholderia sp. 22PA0099]|uniref:DotU/TssL family secretion system protein n=1 Tax=Burkholderia sp. 22PA0099 TaxID=3237372 RepID=UPI0039C1D792
MMASSLPIALRDTALMVATLDQEPLSFDTLRERCDALIARLRDELKRQALARDMIDDACYAQCALLDEAVLQRLTGDTRNAWEHEPLQVAHFASNDAGSELIQRIEQRLRDPQAAPLLLSIFAAILGLGFVGRFSIDGQAARTALMRAIDTRLGITAESQAVSLSADAIVVNASQTRRQRISPLIGVAVAGIAAGLVWLIADRWFIAAIAQLAR